MSTPDPSQAFSEREHYAKTPEIYFSDRTNTLFVGANPLVYPAHQETSQDVTGMQKPSNADEHYEISREDMIGLIGNAWMTLDDEAKGRVKRHLRDTVDSFGFDIRQAMESFANDPEGRQTGYLEPDCELDCMTIPKPKLDPQFFPDWDDTEPWYRKKPIISFTHQDGQLSYVHLGVLAPVECNVIPDHTANVTYPLPSHQVIPVNFALEEMHVLATRLATYASSDSTSAKTKPVKSPYGLISGSLLAANLKTPMFGFWRSTPQWSYSESSNKSEPVEGSHPPLFSSFPHSSSSFPSHLGQYSHIDLRLHPASEHSIHELSDWHSHDTLRPDAIVIAPFTPVQGLKHFVLTPVHIGSGNLSCGLRA